MGRFGQLLCASLLLYWGPLFERPGKLVRVAVMPFVLLLAFTGLLFAVFAIATIVSEAEGEMAVTWPGGSMAVRDLLETCFENGIPKYQICMGLVYDKKDTPSVNVVEQLVETVVDGDWDQTAYFSDLETVEEKIFAWTGYKEAPCSDCILPSTFGYFFILTHELDETSGRQKYNWQLAMQNTDTFDTIKSPSSPNQLFNLTKDGDTPSDDAAIVEYSQGMVVNLYSYIETITRDLLRGEQVNMVDNLNTFERDKQDDGDNHEEVVMKEDNNNGQVSTFKDDTSPIKTAINGSMGAHSPYADEDKNGDIISTATNSTFFPFTYALVFSLLVSLLNINHIISTSSSITRSVCQAGMHPLATLLAALTLILFVSLLDFLGSLLMWPIFPGTFSTLYQSMDFTTDVGLYLVFMTVFGFLVQTSTFGAFVTKDFVANVVALLIAIFIPSIMTSMEIQPSVVPYIIIMFLFPCSFGTVIPSAIQNFKSLAITSASAADGPPEVITTSATRFGFFDIVSPGYIERYITDSVLDDASKQVVGLIRVAPILLVGSIFAILFWTFLLYIGLAVRPKELSGNYNWKAWLERIPNGKALREHEQKVFNRSSSGKRSSKRYAKGVTHDRNSAKINNEKIPLLTDSDISVETILDSSEIDDGSILLGKDSQKINKTIDEKLDDEEKSPRASNPVCTIENVYKYYKLKTKSDEDETGAPSTDRIIRQKGVTKFAAVNGISNAFMERSITGLIGVNGAGKTTLMSMMLGLNRPSRGAISIFGNSVYEDKEAHRRNLNRKEVTHSSTLEYLPLIGFVPQHNIVGAFSCQLHCEIMACIRGVPGGRAMWKKEATRCLKLMGLVQDGKQYSRGSDLSGGQKRRLMVAMALAGRPPLLILDEPSAGLTLDAKQLLDSALRQVAAEQHASIIITEHDLTQVDGLVDEMIIVREGQIVAKGTSLTLKEEYGEGYTLCVSFNDNAEKHLHEIGDTSSLALETSEHSSKIKRRSSVRWNEPVIDILTARTLKICKLYDKEAKIKYRSGRDVFFTLPGYDVGDHLFELGHKLTELQPKLCIDSFAFEIATLSDVFIRLAASNVKSRTVIKSELTSKANSSISEENEHLNPPRYISKVDESDSSKEETVNKIPPIKPVSAPLEEEISEILVSSDISNISSKAPTDARIHPLVHKTPSYYAVLKLLIWKSFYAYTRFHLLFYKMILDLSSFTVILILINIVLPYARDIIDSISKPGEIKNSFSFSDEYTNTLKMLGETNQIYWSYSPNLEDQRDYIESLISQLDAKRISESGQTSPFDYTDITNLYDIVNEQEALDSYIPLTANSALGNTGVIYYEQLRPTVIVFNTTDTVTLYLSPEYYTLSSWNGRLSSMPNAQAESFSRVWNSILLGTDEAEISSEDSDVTSSLRTFSPSSVEVSFPLTVTIFAFYSLLVQMCCGYQLNVVSYIFNQERTTGFCQLLRMNGENTNKQGFKYANVTSWILGILLPYAVIVGIVSYAWTLTPAFIMSGSAGAADGGFIGSYAFLISIGMFFNAILWPAFTMWLSYKYPDLATMLHLMPFIQWLTTAVSIIMAAVMLIVASTVDASDSSYGDTILTIVGAYRILITILAFYPFAFAITFTTDLAVRCHNPEVFNIYDTYAGTHWATGGGRYALVIVGVVMQIVYCALIFVLLYCREAIEAAGSQSTLMKEAKNTSKGAKIGAGFRKVFNSIALLGTRRTSDPASPTDKLKRKIYRVEIAELEAKKTGSTTGDENSGIVDNSSENKDSTTESIIGDDDVVDLPIITSPRIVREPLIRHPHEDDTVREERKLAKELIGVLEGKVASDEVEDPNNFVIIVSECRREFITQGEVRSEPGSAEPTHPSDVVNVAVRDVSLTCSRGECLGIVGENGCGKTVLLEMLLGQMSVTSGTAMVAGNKDNQARIGYVPQINIYHEGLNVRQHIRLFSILGGIPVEEGMQLASFCGLDKEDLLSNFPQRLSGGYKRRLNLAIALITSTEILIADEVAAGVDEHARLAIIEIIDALKSNGCSIILTSQAMDTVERLADRVAVMTKGRLRTVDSPESIKRHFGDGNFVTLQVTKGHQSQAKKWLADVAGVEETKIIELPKLGDDFRFVTPLSCPVLTILDALSPAKRPDFIIRGVVAPPSLQSVFVRLEQETSDLHLSSDLFPL